MRDEMRDIDITNNSNTILMILWILLPKLWRIWKKKDVFNIYDIPFDLLPIFVLSNGWIRFVIWLVIYAVFMFVFWVISTKKISSISNSKSES